MAAIIQNVPTETTTVEMSDTAQSQTGDTQSTTRKWLPSLSSVVGTLLVTLVSVLLSIIISQINSLGNRIDNLDTQLRTEINNVRTELSTELRTEISSVRTEMQAGFAEINAILLDHTDRLARLETAAGLPRPND